MTRRLHQEVWEEKVALAVPLTTIDMEDWVLLEGDGVSLMLPREFEGGSIDEVLQMLDSVDMMLGEEFEDTLQLARNNPDLYRLYAFAPDLMDNSVVANVNITATPFSLNMPMEDILDLMPASFPEIVEIVDSDVVSLGEYEKVGRLIIEMEIMRISQRLVVYIFVIDEQLYGITFTSSANAYKEMHSVFEQIASTFVVTDQE